MLTRKKSSLIFLLFYLFLLIYVCVREAFLYFSTPATSYSFETKNDNNLQYFHIQINNDNKNPAEIGRTADDDAPQFFQEEIDEKSDDIDYESAVDKNKDNKFKRKGNKHYNIHNKHDKMKSALHQRPHYIRRQPSRRTSKILDKKINSFPVNYKKDEFSLYPPAWTIVNLPISYIMNVDACTKTRGDNGKNYVINLVHSKANHITLRQTIRKAFPSSKLENFYIRRIFLLAKPQVILVNNQDDGKLIIKKNSTTFSDYLNGEDNDNDNTDTDFNMDINTFERLRQRQLENVTEEEEHVTMRRLEEEQNEFGDLVMGDFMESYRNLTYKHLMGLEWVTRYCAGAQYILKQDDDVIVEMKQLKNLRPLVQKSIDQYKQNVSLQFGMDVHSKQANKYFKNLKYFVGIVLDHNEPVRDKASYEHGKWFVSYQEFGGKFYPDYVSGWAYVTTVDVARDILKISRKSKFFWIDDVYVSGILREAVGNSSIKTIHMDTSLVPSELWIAEQPHNGLPYT